MLAEAKLLALYEGYCAHASIAPVLVSMIISVPDVDFDELTPLASASSAQYWICESRPSCRLSPFLAATFCCWPSTMALPLTSVSVDSWPLIPERIEL